MRVDYRIIKILVCLILIPAFFIDVSELQWQRSNNALIDLGHVAFFALAIQILLIPNNKKIVTARAIIRALVIILTVGLIIEIIQAFLTNRLFSVGDLGRNIVGGLLGICWISWSQFTSRQKKIYFIGGMALLLITSLPLVYSLYDEHIASEEFPVLSSFKSKREISRWESENHMEILPQAARDGKYGMKVTLLPSAYSGASLKYFPGNWHHMSDVRIDVFNSGDEPLRLIIRIHDQVHERSDQEYSDRYNHPFILEKGWNEITISLTDVRDAPEKRKMDLSQVKSFAFFIADLQERRVVYIDNLVLLKE